MGRPGFNRWGLRGVTHWSIASSVTHFLTSEIWPNRDPLGEQGFEGLNGRKTFHIGEGPNYYRFAANDPVDSIDSDGRAAVAVYVVGGVIVVGVGALIVYCLYLNNNPPKCPPGMLPKPAVFTGPFGISIPCGYQYAPKPCP